MGRIGHEGMGGVKMGCSQLSRGIGVASWGGRGQC